MAATRSKKRETEKLPENQIISRVEKFLKNRKQKKQESENWRDKNNSPKEGEEEEIPYANIRPLPEVTREETTVVEQRRGYKNKAPLQDDGRAIILIKEALKTPVHVTTEDLLNISQTARQELKKLLTKKRVENTVTMIANEKQEEQDNVIHAAQLPSASHEILEEERSGIPKGSVVVGDPVVQYLGNLKPGEKPKRVVVAQESLGLRAVYPLINEEARIESLLDGGSQIVSMAKETAIELKISWDTNVTVEMESANRTLEKTLGLARNVPLNFGHIVVYLQVHIIKQPAYKVLLGRPFDSVTESLVKNERDGSQVLVLTDPYTGERCSINTYERGKQPEVLDEPLNRDFQFSMN